MSDGAVFAGVGAICDSAAELTGTDGAAVVVLTPAPGINELVHATDALAHQIDQVQYTVGEGPCLDAYHRSEDILCPRLADSAFALRWPGFISEATALRVAAVFAFPILGTQRPLGVLQLYRRTGGDLAPGQHRAAQVCASALSTALLSIWRDTETAADPLTRSQVHVAAGMVAVQLSVSSSEGLDRLRAYSYARGQSILTVAADVVARRMSFRGLDSTDLGVDST
ncbi:GAF domain-containing protein [soil metagenome]